MKILVVRRDNIGDLVLTTPVFTALRRRYPEARIEALVNSYNAPAIEGHPDLDQVHVYTKAKHADSQLGVLHGWKHRLEQGWRLRATRYDFVILASPGHHPRQVNQARLMAPREIVAFALPGAELPRVSRAVPWEPQPMTHHVVETFRILSALGIEGEIPPPRIAVAPPEARAPGPVRIGLHVSARRPRNRWTEARHIALARSLHDRHDADVRLFWSPGAEDDPRHPGDDAMAARIVEAARDASLQAVPTTTLRQLMESLAACDLVVCSDGGALHLAAALGKPIACFFGDTEPAKWHPWGVPYRVLRPASHDVADVPLEAAIEAVGDLLGEAKPA
jgi:ADP-heptose:LPS heptosyltransferase